MSEEIDLLVAEHVFQNKPCQFVGTGVRENRHGTVSEFCVKCGDPHGYHVGVPLFSTFIAAAWQVVEKMRANGWTMAFDCMGFDGEEWRCQFDLYDEAEDESTRHHAEHTTAPMAICLAALKACGVETPCSADRCSL